MSMSENAPMYQPMIPGMAPEDRVDTGKMPPPISSNRQSSIPGEIFYY
jgi:hypothetical protein